MKRISYCTITLLLTVTAIFSLQYVYAQKNVEVNGQDVGSWFGNHWMWIAGGIVLLIILLLASSGGRTIVKRKSTTIVKDDNGNVKRVTTTEDL